jgi:glycosyltransferase involved in cell wall biosynthesis
MLTSSLMNIVHFLQGRCNPDSANGVEKTVYNLSLQQAAMGHDVHIVSITEKPVIPIAGVCIHHCYPSISQLQSLHCAWSLIKSIKADIVHFHSMYVLPNALLAFLLRRQGIPYAVTPNGNCSTELLRRRWYLKLPYKYLLERPYLNRARVIHSVGDTQQIRDYGVVVPIVTAPNGIDRKEIPLSGSANPILAARPDWQDRTIFCYVGRLDLPQKGLDLLLEGFAKALQCNPNLGLVLVGPDWKGYKAKLVHLARSLLISHAVYFAGPAYQKTKFDFISSADFFVHTSRWEGLPFSVLEALACGKPCLVSAAANPCGLIGAYKAGKEVELVAVDIANTIVEMAQTEKMQRAAMSKEAHKLVDLELQWPTIAKRVTDAYLNKPTQS